MPLDRETGRKRGFAFVDLNSADEEKKAIDDLQDVEWMGRAISVRVAEPRRRPSLIRTAYGCLILKSVQVFRAFPNRSLCV